MQGIAEWLASIGLEEYAERFIENDIDLLVVRDLTDQDLKELGVSLGHRRKILRCASELAAVDVSGSPVFSGTIREPIVESRRGNVPKHLSNKFVTSRNAWGERKQVTVLFCDIVQSSRLAESIGPEAMHELLDRALEIMARAVHRYEGTVNQFLGDGLMALFGAPLAVENHPMRAAEAAIAIREAIAQFNLQLNQERNVEVKVRIGLNTGLVVVGNLGDNLRTDYTAFGETTHLAAHLEQAAESGTILLSESTYQLIQRDVRVELVEALSLKNRPKPITVYRLVGLHANSPSPS